MIRQTFLLAAAAFTLASCASGTGNSAGDDEDVGNAGATAATNTPSAPAPDATAPKAEPRESLPEPKGRIDPKSAEGAGQVMQLYGALIEQGRWGEAARSWSDAGAAQQFRATLEDYPEVHLLIGKPTDQEGAAGSIFITVPTTLDLVLRNGSRSQQACSATLRRVNDVPGATAKQLRWNIQSIAC